MALQTELKPEDWRFCVAPMIDWTDEWCRHFHRLLSKRARLYTEMIASPALVHGNRARLLGYEKGVNPVALQLGGSNPAELAQCAKWGEEAGFDEICGDIMLALPEYAVRRLRRGPDAFPAEGCGLS